MAPIIAISTGCFIPPTRDIWRLKPSALWGFMNPMVEVKQALEAVERLNLAGIELALRTWPMLGFSFWPWRLFIRKLQGKVLGVHGQVGGSWSHVLRWVASDPLTGAMVAAMGVWDRGTESLAHKLEAQYLVIHPETIGELGRRRIFLPSDGRRVTWGFENNWTTVERKVTTLGWTIWDMLEIAETHNLSVVLDISHLLLTNQLLIKAWENLGERVKAIHFSGAVPWTPELGGTPPNLLPDSIQDQMRELLQEIKDQNLTITIELSPTTKWRNEVATMEGVENTLTFLGEIL